MKVCQNCNKEKSLRTTKLCHACYQGKTKLGENYKPKIYKKELLGTKCIQCEKLREKEWDIERQLCRSCYLYSLPGYKERHKKITRDYQRRKRGIDTELPLINAPAGTGYISKDGYKKICKLELRGHLNADKKGRMFEHTYVMSNYLGRPLRKKELVHHKNGIRHDNRIENLELCHIGQPPGQRVEDKIKWCIDFLNDYGYDVIKKQV